MIGFAEKGKGNTAEAVRLAVETAKRYETDIVAATSTGSTAKALLEEAARQGYHGQIVAVGLAYKANENAMSREMQAELAGQGVRVVLAGHALSGIERGLSSVFKGLYPAELIAHVLRMFGAGMKVCAECSLMAADAGAVRTDRPAVAIAGTGGGADTVVVLTPANSSNVLDMRFHEIICKPLLLPEQA